MARGGDRGRPGGNWDRRQAWHACVAQLLNCSRSWIPNLGRGEGGRETARPRVQCLLISQQRHRPPRGIWALQTLSPTPFPPEHLVDQIGIPGPAAHGPGNRPATSGARDVGTRVRDWPGARSPVSGVNAGMNAQDAGLQCRVKVGGTRCGFPG